MSIKDKRARDEILSAIAERNHDRIARNAATILAGVESTKHGPIPVEVAVPYCVSRAIAIEAEVAKQMEVAE